jgi:hypothetical protein
MDLARTVLALYAGSTALIIALTLAAHAPLVRSRVRPSTRWLLRRAALSLLVAGAAGGALAAVYWPLFQAAGIR